MVVKIIELKHMEKIIGYLKSKIVKILIIWLTMLKENVILVSNDMDLYFIRIVST